MLGHIYNVLWWNLQSFFAHSANVIVESEATLDTRKEQVIIKSVLPCI